MYTWRGGNWGREYALKHETFQLLLLFLSTRHELVDLPDNVIKDFIDVNFVSCRSFIKGFSAPLLRQHHALLP